MSDGFWRRFSLSNHLPLRSVAFLNFPLLRSYFYVPLYISKFVLLVRIIETERCVWIPGQMSNNSSEANIGFLLLCKQAFSTLPVYAEGNFWSPSNVQFRKLRLKLETGTVERWLVQLLPHDGELYCFVSPSSSSSSSDYRIDKRALSVLLISCALPSREPQISLTSSKDYR